MIFLLLHKQITDSLWNFKFRATKLKYLNAYHPSIYLFSPAENERKQTGKLHLGNHSRAWSGSGLNSDTVFTHTLFHTKTCLPSSDSFPIILKSETPSTILLITLAKNLPIAKRCLIDFSSAIWTRKTERDLKHECLFTITRERSTEMKTVLGLLCRNEIRNRLNTTNIGCTEPRIETHYQTSAVLTLRIRLGGEYCSGGGWEMSLVGQLFRW